MANRRARTETMHLAGASENGEDRLSRLPFDLICLILSYLEVKDAAKTMVLSRSFRSIWTFTPSINYFSSSFLYLRQFDLFVERSLSLRNNLARIESFNFTRGGVICFQFFLNIMRYAMSRGVRNLNFRVQHSTENDCPDFMYSSDSLVTLILRSHGLNLKKPLSCPMLTVLCLDGVSILEFDLFSRCQNLRDLTLVDCSIGPQILNISAPELSKLTIGMVHSRLVKSKFVLLTPKLVSFTLSASYPVELSTHGLPSLATVNINLDKFYCDLESKELRMGAIPDLIDMLQYFCDAKDVVLSSGAVKILCEFPDLVMHGLSPFSNLESLIIKISDLCPLLFIPASVLDFLRNQTPTAKIFLDRPRSYSLPWF